MSTTNIQSKELTQTIRFDPFEVSDSTWIDRKDSDLALAVRDTFLRPFPLKQPRDRDGKLSTNYDVKTTFGHIQFTARSEWGIPVAKDNILEILIWSKAIKNNSPEVYLGKTSELMRELGLPRSKQGYEALKKQFMRLATYDAFLTDTNSDSDNIRLVRPGNWIEKMSLWFNGDFSKENGNYIKITQKFFDQLINLNFKIDLDVGILRHLKSHPGATQLYLQTLFLNHHVNSSGKDVMAISLEDLQANMGFSEDRHISKFVIDLRKWLDTIQDAFYYMYGGEKTQIPFRIVGDSLVFGKANLLPVDVAIEDDYKEYLDSLPTENARQGERESINQVLLNGFTSDQIKAAFNNVKEYGDSNYRQKKRIFKYLTKTESMEEILKRVEKQEKIIH